MGLLSQDADVQVFKPGEMIDCYRVMAELGRGAASIIYLVNDTNTKRIHALKHVVKTTEKDDRFLEQTQAEYDIGSKLDHPVIRKMDRLIKKRTGLLAVTEMFLLMELVDGESLDKKPPRTFDVAADIFEQVAKGLAHMHNRGFVHADMKPNNVVVSAGGVVKVIDLGQSCAVNTVKKRIQGTPDYIAPEQVHRRPITHKTDIYNLGATMYWSLTKHFVPTALAKGDSLVGSLDDTMIKPPKRPIEINRRVPELFDKLIMDCVQIEPAARPDSMGDVAERLNLIRGKLLAEAELRKSGSFKNVGEAND